MIKAPKCLSIISFLLLRCYYVRDSSTSRLYHMNKKIGGVGEADTFLCLRIKSRVLPFQKDLASSAQRRYALVDSLEIRIYSKSSLPQIAILPAGIHTPSSRTFSVYFVDRTANVRFGEHTAECSGCLVTKAPGVSSFYPLSSCKVESTAAFSWRHRHLFLRGTSNRTFLVTVFDLRRGRSVATGHF